MIILHCLTKSKWDRVKETHITEKNQLSLMKKQKNTRIKAIESFRQP
jgi:hypothetical protein